MAIELLQNLNPEWPNVMQTHRNWLSSVVYARLRDSDAVEEVLQETALAASKSNQLVEDHEGVFKWLYQVAIRQAMLYRRRKIRSDQRIREAGGRQATQASERSESASPLRLLIASEDRDQVRAAMSRLNKKDCEILMLKYCDGWSCRDVGIRLGVTESAIKSRLLRARNSLRIELLKLDESWGAHE